MSKCYKNNNVKRVVQFKACLFLNNLPYSVVVSDYQLKLNTSKCLSCIKNVKTCKNRCEKQILDICWSFSYTKLLSSCSIFTCSQYPCVCVCVPISLRRLGGQPAVGASAQSVVLTASHSSFIEVPSTGVCVCVCVHVCVWQVWRRMFSLSSKFSQSATTIISGNVWISHT